MTKIDKAVEIVRGWSDEDIKKFIFDNYFCPYSFLRGNYLRCEENTLYCYEEGWNEEVEE